MTHSPFAAMLAEHRPEGPLCCCLRTLPCPVAHAVQRRRDEDRARLGWLGEETVLLPVVPLARNGARHRAARPAGLLHWWRRR